jgi:general secretion pathway protein J
MTLARVHTRRRAAQRSHGFTLVEVLVALFAMALLTSMAWRGLDSVMRSRDAARDSIDATVRLSTVLSQWDQDLNALHDTLAVPALQFDGQTLRLTRRTENGVALVTWALRSGAWQRWMSPSYTRRLELQQAWQRSQQFLGNEPGQLAVARGASEWQLYFFRSGAWSNAQSTGDFRVVRPARVAAPAPPATNAAATATVAAAAPGTAGVAQAGTSAGAPPGAAPGAPTGVPTGASPGVPPGAPAAAPGTAPPSNSSAIVTEQPPEAVRLVITLGGRRLKRDVLLGPAAS